VVEALADVGDLSRLDGFSNSETPQNTSIDGERVGMGDRRDPRGCSGDAVAIAKAGESDGSSTHQRTVSCGVIGTLTEVRGCRSGQVAAVDRSREDRTSLVPDVVRFARPRDEAVTEGIEIEISGGGLFGDADCHLRVIGPLTRLPAEWAAALHLDRPVERRTEFVAGTERIAGGEADEDPGCPVEPGAQPVTDPGVNTLSIVRNRLSQLNV
jgi:hypothetical protein